MVDCFYPDKGHFDGFREENYPIKVSSEAQAISEAKRTAFGKRPHHFHVRAIGSAGEIVVYRSENA